MEEIHIAGTGIWYPDDIITNDEIVLSFNKYVDNFNEINKDLISNGSLNQLEHSSVEFIEKASGIKTRHVVDKKNILDVERMMPSLKHEMNQDYQFKLSRVFMLQKKLWHKLMSRQMILMQLF
jgi:beta-ketodecanoyl-[acyl-carrier-protein] synthase